MRTSTLPQGEQAALLPGAHYSVPGLFLYSDLLYRCMDETEARFSYRLPIQYAYGSPKVRWNCGRLMLTEDYNDLGRIRAELAGAVTHGITPLLTFSAPDLTEEDLKDPMGNEILAIANETGGGVIVSSPLLRDHIRAHYPHLEVHASVILTAFTEERDLAYYEGLARDYDRYVLHPDDNFRLDLLAQLPKDKAEIIVNEPCGFHCPQRKEHYLSITLDQAALIEERGELTDFLDRCPYVPNKKQREMKERNIALDTDEVTALHQMDFSLFKLQGRLDIPYAFFFDLFRYSLESRVAFPAMYPPFCFDIRAHLKEKAKRRAREKQR